MELRIAILAVFYSLVVIIGVTGNIVMIIVTIKSRKLQSVCNFLIFALCLADLLHLLCQIPNSITLLIEVEIKQRICFFIELFPMIGAMSASVICLALGVDRYTAVAFPIFYRDIQLQKSKCMMAYMLLPAVYTLWILGTAYLTTTEEITTRCGVPQALGLFALKMVTYSNFVINTAVIALYMVIWRLVSTKTLAKSFRSIFKSIFITVMLIIFGWIATTVINLFVFSFMENPSDMEFVHMYAGFFVNGACAANIFVYFTINKEYRREIRKLFCKKEELILDVHEGTRLRKSNDS